VAADRARRAATDDGHGDQRAPHRAVARRENVQTLNEKLLELRQSWQLMERRARDAVAPLDVVETSLAAPAC